MSKTKGPFFEFELVQNGPVIEFVFEPGNIVKEKFEGVAQSIYNIFQSQYSIKKGDACYARKITLDNGINTIAIDQRKVINVIEGILTISSFSGFRVVVKGRDRNGNPKEELITNSIQINKAKEVVPYYHRNNNDMTCSKR